MNSTTTGPENQPAMTPIEVLKSIMNNERRFYEDAHQAWLDGDMPSMVLKQYRADYLLAASRYEQATRPVRQSGGAK